MYPEFAGWLDRVLERRIPVEVVAYVFNLYEGESSFDIQLAGCPSFKNESDEWAVAHVFTTGEDLCSVLSTSFDDDWSTAISGIRKLIVRYLSEGAQSQKLMAAKAVAVGFVDGDLDVIRAVA